MSDKKGERANNGRTETGERGNGRTGTQHFRDGLILHQGDSEQSRDVEVEDSEEITRWLRFGRTAWPMSAPETPGSSVPALDPRSKNGRQRREWRSGALGPALAVDEVPTCFLARVGIA